MSEEMTRDYRWYIVHTQHGYENKVRERLEKRIKENGMSDLVVDIYIPSETVQKNKNGKKELFFSYFFTIFIFLYNIKRDF